MQKEIRILSILLLMTFLCCNHKISTKQECDFEKAFISVDSFIKIQNINQNDSLKYSLFPFLPAINYDSLKSFSQIDSMEKYVCKNKLASYFGVIPLKYVYNSDTILLPAFPIACECCGDFFINNQITISLTDNKITLNYSDLSYDIGKTSLIDTLCNIFCRKFDPFFKRQKEINDKVTDTSKIKELAWNHCRKTKWLISVELQNDNQWSRIKEPIDLILTSYLMGLKTSMINNYKKELCQLNTFELRLFSGILFINFEFSKIED